MKSYWKQSLNIYFCITDALSQSNIAMIESFMELSPTDKKPSDDEAEGGATPTGGVSEEVEKAYQDMLQLLKLNKTISSAPQVLEEKYNNMEHLGKDITLSISKLQQATESLRK